MTYGLVATDRKRTTPSVTCATAMTRAVIHKISKETFLSMLADTNLAGECLSLNPPARFELRQCEWRLGDAMGAAVLAVGVLPLTCSAACPGFLVRGRGLAWPSGREGAVTGCGLVRSLRGAGRRRR
jgi:hypothetical protein